MARKTPLTIEQEIVASYQAEDGDWIVEKGKVKECKFLKRAVARIEELSEALEKIETAYDEKRWEIVDYWEGRNNELSEQLYAMRDEKQLWFDRACRLRDAFNEIKTEVEDWNS